MRFLEHSSAFGSTTTHWDPGLWFLGFGWDILWVFTAEVFNALSFPISIEEISHLWFPFPWSLFGCIILCSTTWNYRSLLLLDTSKGFILQLEFMFREWFEFTSATRTEPHSGFSLLKGFKNSFIMEISVAHVVVKKSIHKLKLQLSSANAHEQILIFRN